MTLYIILLCTNISEEVIIFVIVDLDNKLQRLKSDINRIEDTQSRAKTLLDIVLNGINGLPTGMVISEL